MLYDSNAPYLEKVRQDFCSLGLTYGDWSAFGKQTREKADVILRSTRFIGHVLKPEKFPQPQTAFGRRVSEIMDMGIRFNMGPSTLGFCFESERNLALMVTDEYSRAYPTTLITRKKHPIAIIKGVGEASMFGLIDNIKHSVVADSFIHPGLHFDRRELLSTGAKIVSVDIAYFGTVFPNRLSTFAMPDSERALFNDEKERESLDLTRGALLEWANDMHASSLRLSVKEMQAIQQPQSAA